MDRHLKKVAKQDEFKEQVWHSIDFVKEHPAEIKKYGGLALAVLLVGGGIYFYMHHQSTAREDALSAALKVDDATVGATVQPQNMHFNTQEEKDKAVDKAFREVAAKYPGTQEAAIANMNLGQSEVDKGDLAGGEKDYKTVVDSAPEAYASQAALALAQLYNIEGKTAEAQKLLDNLIKHPSVTVSKDEAQLAMARVQAKTDPHGACKLLDSLRTERAAISRAAMSELGDLASVCQ